MKKRCTKKQIMRTIKRLNNGEKATALCKELGVAYGTLYLWKKKFGSGPIDQTSSRIKELEAENAKLKQVVLGFVMEALK